MSPHTRKSRRGRPAIVLHDRTSLGAAIRRARTRHRWTLVTLGQQIGRRASTVHSWEHGKRTPGHADLVALARLLSLDLARLARLAGRP